ncbi:NAD(P)-dependent oxidoreductase [bacterium]|nr:NAD(P)-dependent oxidoreductase [bacterium]
MEKKKILLTGSTGFIGSHTASALLDAGADLILFSRRKNELTKEFEKRGATIYTASFTDSKALESALKDVDIVVHVAAATNGVKKEDLIFSNVTFTEEILKRFSKRMIHVSSLSAAGPSFEGVPIKEGEPERPQNWYGESKLEAEQVVKKWGEQNDNNFVILRPSPVFGPREKDFFQYFSMMKMGIRFILGTGKQRISMAYADDVVSSITFMITHPEVKGETFFVCGDSAPDWLEIAAAIQEGMDKKRAMTLKLPEFFVYPVTFVNDIIQKFTKKPALLNSQKLADIKQDSWMCSNEKLKKLGWKPSFSFKEAIKMTAEWYKKEGWL